MRLLIITQSVDIKNLLCGFFIDWIKEFSRHCEKVTVICLEKGEYEMPPNVEVLSLGKEQGRSNLKYIYNFYKYIWRERKKYDEVFVHMNQVYVILGGLFWRIWRKKIGFWYAHGHVPYSLKIAEKLTHIIFTSTQGGFRLASQKIKVVGQGIDISRFKHDEAKTRGEVFKIITISRISPVKNYETLIDAIEILHNQGVKNIQVDILGAPAAADQEAYLINLKKNVSEKKLDKIIFFPGPVFYLENLKQYQSADLFINTSLTGSLDKVILEAMACNLLVVSCNDAFGEILKDNQELKNLLVFPKGDSAKLAEKINSVMKLEPDKTNELGNKLREMVKNDHAISGLINKIISNYVTSR